MPTIASRRTRVGTLTGVKPLAPQLDTVGFMVRSLDDVPIVSGVLAGGAPPEPAPVRQPKVAVLRTAQWHLAGPETHKLIEVTAARLAEAGATVRRVDLPEPFGRLESLQRILMAELDGPRARSLRVQVFGIT